MSTPFTPGPIRRYDMILTTRCGEGWQELQPEPEGEWMRYEDHLAALASERQHMLQPVTDEEWQGRDLRTVLMMMREEVDRILAARLERAKAVQP